MAYRFKSRATGDMVMLDQTARQVLDILGKDTQGPGILLPEQMPAAVAALQAAVQQAESDRARQVQEAEAKGERAPEPESVSLRMRVAPLIEMIRRSEAEKAEIVWGV